MQQAPAAQLTSAQAPAGELLGHRSPARSRAAFAPRPSGRSCWPLTASAPARQISSVKRTQSTRCDKEGTLFLSACRISNCARTKCTGGNRRAGEQAVLGPTARGTGAAPLTYGQARHACCSRCAHPGPVLQLEAKTSFHVALELEHVESVDLRSEIRKADAVLPVFARAGQRSDTLKRVARRGRCRLLFRLGVQHILLTHTHHAHLSPLSR